MNYNVFTDGACSGNGKENAKGGWGFVILDEHNKKLCEDSGFEANTTNNRMELIAAIKAIEKIEEIIDGFDKVTIFTDSAYLCNCYLQKWYLSWQRNGWANAKKQPVANPDLWKKLIPYFENYNFNFSKVRGHDTRKLLASEWNDYVDKLAVAARLNGGKE